MPITPVVPIASALQQEELAGAQEARRAASAVFTANALKAGQEAASLLKMILELPETERGPLRALYTQMLLKLQLQVHGDAAAATPASPPSSAVAVPLAQQM